MVKTLVCCALLAGAMLTLAGCATIVHGTKEKVQIDSNPGGADVVIDDSQHFTTPAKVKLARGSAHKLVFHKPGYQDDTENLTSSASAWMLGNLLGGGAIGMAIDASDGAARKLSADRVDVTLRPVQPQVQTQAPLPDGQPQAQQPAALPVSSQTSELRRYLDDDADYAAPSSDGLQP